jgi:hypothetical protein
MAGALEAGDLAEMKARSMTVALAVTAIGLAACGGSGDPDLDRFLMRKGEEPGFRPGALPGAMPETRQTITGVEAVVKEFGLTQADAQRLRRDGFISSISGPIRGPGTAGITTVDVYETEEGAKNSQAHELSSEVIGGPGPVEGLRYFTVSGVPGARGWTASEPHVANVVWVQGRCMFVLGNQGPGRLTGRLAAGVRAIYARTHGECR